MTRAPPVTRVRVPAPRRTALASLTGPLSDRALDRPGEPSGLVVVPGELGGPKEGGYRPRIGPVAVVDPAEQAPVGDVVVEDVGDLELAAARGGEGVDDRERVGPEEVDPDRDQVALRMGRLLLEPHDATVRVELRDAEPLTVGDPVEERAGAP